MLVRSLITGAVATVILLAVLVGSRLMGKSQQEEVIQFREVNVVELTPPPEPPDFLELEPKAQELESTIPEPMLAIDFALARPHVKAPTIQASPLMSEFSTQVESFALDSLPAALPKKIKPGVRPKQTSGSANRVAQTRKPAVVHRSSVAVGRLDTKPRELKKGHFRWPARAKGRTGVVKLLIEIDTKGRVRVVRVVNSSNPALNTAASRVASGSRFTVPKYNGKPVKTQFTYTYNLKKPR